MDRKYANAIDFITLYRLDMQSIIPFSYESIDICSVICNEVIKGVVEGADIGALIAQFMEGKECEQALYKIK